MSLRLKLTVIIVFVSLVPLAITAYSTLGIHQQAFDRKLSEISRLSVRSGASLVQAQLSGYRKTLRQVVESIRWGELSPAEREGALWLLYRQLDDIVIISLLDETGRGVGPSVYRDDSVDPDDLAAHPVATLAMLKTFAAFIPASTAVDSVGSAGELFSAPDSELVMLPLAFYARGPHGPAKWTVVVALSLNGICEKVRSMGTGDTVVHWVEPKGRAVCSSAGDRALVPVHPKLKNRTTGSQLSELRYRDERGEEILATVAPMANGFAMVTEQAVRAAFSSSSKMRDRTIFWIIVSVIVAGTTGMLLGRSISVPVRRLVKGASELARGQFDYRLKTGGRDELAKLSSTFNEMSAEIERRESEIRQWNQELQDRVEEQTREIKEVQDQLLHSQKIAAVTSLGAGFAHEINNPLTGVIGYTQLMLKMAQKDKALAPYGDFLQRIENESKRIEKVVTTLLRFSREHRGEKKSVVLELTQLIDSVAMTFAEEFASKGIALDRQYAADTQRITGNATTLHQLFYEILKNATIAMPQGGAITIRTSVVDGRVIKTVIEDTGKGIEEQNLDQIFEPFFTTKENWSGEGLGLTLAFQAVEEHHGSIRADSTPGRGTTITVILPALKGGAHLA